MSAADTTFNSYPPAAPGRYLYFFPSQKTSDSTPSLSTTRTADTAFFLKVAPDNVTRSKRRLIITNFAFGFSARQPSLPEPWITMTSVLCATSSVENVEVILGLPHP